jgi:hypothetical protein
MITSHFLVFFLKIRFLCSEDSRAGEGDEPGSYHRETGRGKRKPACNEHCKNEGNFYETGQKVIYENSNIYSITKHLRFPYMSS